jgi:hypothetical protein
MSRLGGADYTFCRASKGDYTFVLLRVKVRNGGVDLPHRAPELELIRHVRNGIGHGNRFDIRDPSRSLLSTLPTIALRGTGVLFDFAGPADLLDVLTSAKIYLKRMGVGDPLRS